MKIRPRDIALVCATLAIISAVVYKQTRTYMPQSALTELAQRRPAPLFELYDSDNKLVKLSGYVGRHIIVVAFFDGKIGATEDGLLLLLLRDNIAKLQAQGIEVFAVSTALPQENRKAIAESGDFGFALLSDPGLAVHQMWGRVNEATQETIPGVFVIDRAGNVPWSGKAPKPEPDAARAIEKLVD